jgi:alpha-glucuronidase
MKRSDIQPMPRYFGRYINQVADVELGQAFLESLRQLDELDRNVLRQLAGQCYAPGKWTVREILQHLIDWERILSIIGHQAHHLRLIEEKYYPRLPAQR